MAQIRLRDATNTLRVIKQIRLRDETNTTRLVKQVRIRDNINFIRTAFQNFIAAVNPTYVSGTYTGTTPATANITTGSTQVAVTGGVAPYTKAWSQVAPTSYTWVITSPSASSTTFTANNVESGVFTQAQFRITVTDTNGATATAIVTAGANNQGTTTAPPTAGTSDPDAGGGYGGPPTVIP